MANFPPFFYSTSNHNLVSHFHHRQRAMDVGRTPENETKPPGSADKTDRKLIGPKTPCSASGFHGLWVTNDPVFAPSTPMLILVPIPAPCCASNQSLRGKREMARQSVGEVQSILNEDLLKTPVRPSSSGRCGVNALFFHSPFSHIHTHPLTSSEFS